jgi:hypothetical protein
VKCVEFHDFPLSEKAIAITQGGIDLERQTLRGKVEVRQAKSAI